MLAVRSITAAQQSFAKGAFPPLVATVTVRFFIIIASMILGLGIWTVGASTGIEDTSRKMLFAAQSREASGQLHVVEMDAASLAAINLWPWPRRHYAALVDRLSAAGARSIVFDVDFSTPSNPADDALLANALAKANSTIVLPTFSQKMGQADSRMLDAMPIPELREHAMLASVAVAPDKDGFVHRLPLGTVTGGMPRPSLSAQIAGRAGSAGQSYPLDLSIDPDTIPRHSFTAIKNGRFQAHEFEGKDVLIGATAIEMGDRYAVAGQGVIPGVIVQALGAETLYNSVPVSYGPLGPLLISFLLSILISVGATRQIVIIRSFVAMITLLMAHFLAWSAQSALFEIVPAMVSMLTATSLSILMLFRSDLRKKRMHDAKTGLPNRIAMEAVEFSVGQIAVATIIGGYEKLHAVLGADLSAELVKRISERLAIGNGGRPIYRIEDRMLAWASSAQGIELEQMLAGLCAVMRSPIEIGGRRIDVQVAFGIAEPTALAEATLCANEALRIGVQWQYHVAAEDAALERQISLMGELDTAIKEEQLEVLYQPKLHLPSDQIRSVEALIRWHHPDRGYLRPDMFIPLAEESDRICDLTLFVLRRTIEDLSGWCAKGLVLSAAVNISARLVTSELFLTKAEALLKRLGVPRHRLIFEVTESATITDPIAAAAALQLFRNLGVSISMDDYGTGQSSLTYLKQLPLSELKIDRSFVQFSHRDKSDAMLVRSTVDLAHELGLSVVAEGVEEKECLHFLREIGCDYAQGYFIGKPMSAPDLQLLVTEQLRMVA